MKSNDLHDWICRHEREKGRRPAAIPLTRLEMNAFRRDTEHMLTHRYGKAEGSRRNEFLGIPIVLRPDALALRQAGVGDALEMPELGEMFRFHTVSLPEHRLSQRAIFPSVAQERRPYGGGPTIMEQVLCSFSTSIYGHRDQMPEAFTWPDGWFEAFKDRWFPAWAKEIWPVKWKVVQVTLDEFYPGFEPAIPDRDVALVVRTRQFTSAF